MDRITSAIQQGRKGRVGKETEAIFGPRISLLPPGEILSEKGRKGVRLAIPVQLFLLSMLIPALFGIGPLVMTSVRLVLILICVPSFMRAQANSNGTILFIDIMFIFHVLWVLVSIMMNNPERVLEHVGSTGIDFLGAYLLGRAYIRSVDDFASLCRFYVVSVCLTLPLALIESITGFALLPYLVQKLPAVSTYPLVSDIRLGLRRAQVAFPHSIHYGVYSSASFSLCILGLHAYMNAWKRSLCSVVLTVCTFLSLSSGALLSIFAQVILLIWSSLMARVPGKWIIFFLLFLVMYISVDIMSNRTPLRVFMSYATFSASTAYIRSIIFDYGVENIMRSPIFGIGLNDWTRPVWLSASVDNFWLLMGMRYGLPGLSFLAVGYCYGFFKVCRAKRENVVEYQRAWIFTIAGLTLSLFTVHVWGPAYSLVFFLFGSGLWMLNPSFSSRPESVESRQMNPGKAVG